MKIALLLGVSKYHNGINDLPGCENDFKSVSSLLNSTGNYDQVEEVFDEPDSVSFKQKITSFFHKNKSNSIDELFFYYTGHGDFSNDEFYYIFPDFDESKRKQTSFQNTEMDNLIKSIKPKLVVKLIDACKSGVSYVKDNKGLDTYIKGTSENFNSCYFMHSSLNNQYSYQDANLSEFTRSFLLAINDFTGHDIRYKDIIDYIADHFANKEEQTPFFVVQAELTEKFCELTHPIREALSSFIIPEKEIPADKEADSQPVSVTPAKLTMKDKIASLSKEYKTEDETHEILNNIRNKIEGFTLSDDLNDLFEINFEFPSYLSKTSGLDKIGRILSRSKISYFYDLEYDIEEYEEMTRPSQFDRLTGVTPQMVKKTRKVISGYSLNGDYPYSQILIDLKAKYKALIDFHMKICFVTSDKDIRIFNLITYYVKTNFQQKRVSNRYEWESQEFKLSEEESIYFHVEEILDSLTQKITTYLEKNFNE